MDTRILALAALSAVTSAHAAPTPFARPAPQGDVEIRGALPGQPWQPGAAARVAAVVTSEAAYRALAEAWGVKAPPPVNFRTHFVVAVISHGHGGIRCDAAGGDLRVLDGVVPPADGAEVGGFARIKFGLKCSEGPPSPQFLIKSFRRSAVKTVTGRPLLAW